MKSLAWLVSLRDTVKCVPSSKEGSRNGPPSNGELRRWCQNGAVVINRKRVAPGDEVSFPVKQLLFFPRSPQSRTTVVHNYKRLFDNDWVGGPSNRSIFEGIFEIHKQREELLALKKMARGDVRASSSGG